MAYDLHKSNELDVNADAFVRLGQLPVAQTISYSRSEIANMAKLLAGTIWTSNSNPDQRFTTAEFITTMTRMVGNPISVPFEFERNGADLDLTEITLEEATTGDLLIFCDWDSPRPWHAGVMLSESINDARAQFVGCGHCQSVSTFWLAGGKWLPNLTRAYRLRSGLAAEGESGAATRLDSHTHVARKTHNALVRVDKAKSFEIDAAALSDPTSLGRLIDALIERLDDMSGDPDLEPALGSQSDIDQRKWAQGVTDDREVECEDEGAQCEDEGHDSDTEPNGDEDDYSPCEDQFQPIDLWSARNRDYASITGLLPKVMNLGFHGPVI